MNKEQLMKMGLSEDQANQVLGLLSDNFVPIGRFNEINTELVKSKEATKERDKQLEELKKSTGDTEALKKQIETLQADNRAKEETYKVEMQKVKLDTALDLALTGAKAKNIKAIKALLDSEKIKLKEDGSLDGLNEQIEAIKKSDSYLFEATPQTTVPKGHIPAPAAPEGTNNQPAAGGLGAAIAAAFTSKN